MTHAQYAVIVQIMHFLSIHNKLSCSFIHEYYNLDKVRVFQYALLHAWSAVFCYLQYNFMLVQNSSQLSFMETNSQILSI